MAVGTTSFATHFGTGDHASRPAYDAVPAGYKYACSDHQLIYESDGVSAWSTWHDPDVDGSVTTHEADADAHHAKYLDAEAVAAVEGTVKLDDLAAPDDNTDLDATTSAHGLPKLPGGTTTFLRADGAYAVPPGGGSTARQFGGAIDSPVAGDEFDIPVDVARTIDAGVLVGDVAGTAEVDVWVVAGASHPSTVANSIVASAPLALSSAAYSKDSTLTGWTKGLSVGDVIRVHVNSVSGLGRLSVVLQAS